jgi:hypothetical protein
VALADVVGAPGASARDAPESSVARDVGEHLVEDRGQLGHERLEREHVVDLSGQRWPGGDRDALRCRCSVTATADQSSTSASRA